jgi:hypothetical protein
MFALASSNITSTIEIAPGVSMPRINLGTCCGSEVHCRTVDANRTR